MIVSVCVASGASPEAVNTGSEVRLPGSPGPKVSTTAGAPPSICTVATPQTLHFTPIQLTAAPVKLKVAVAVAWLEARIAPPLKVPVSGP